MATCARKLSYMQALSLQPAWQVLSRVVIPLWQPRLPPLQIYLPKSFQAVGQSVLMMATSKLLKCCECLSSFAVCRSCCVCACLREDVACLYQASGNEVLLSTC
jgi:hypothetical protein